MTVCIVMFHTVGYIKNISNQSKLNAVLIVIGVIFAIGIVPAHAQITSEFGYQLHPDKLLENTEATLQVFVTSNEMMVPKQIQNLKVVSSDNAIVQVLRIEDGNDKFTKNVIIKANKPGIASIALAATSFSSKEISFQVYTNNNYASQILMKTTPEEFPIDGPRFGYVALELATTGGLPTVTTEDIMIHLDTPNKDVIKIKNPELLISNGEYYAITEFEIIGTGDAIIFAEAEGMKRISSIVRVLEAIKPLQLQLHIFPENYISFSGTEGYAIVQLLDGEGLPVLAEEDIPLRLIVENPDVSINTSGNFEEVIIEKDQLVIEKGSYSAFTTFSPRPNLGEFTSSLQQKYNMFISADNVLTNGASFNVIHDEIGALEGKGPSITKVLPFLTTGNKEIIAVTYYETTVEVSRQSGGLTVGESGSSTNRELASVTVPVTAKEDHEISFSSSEIDTVNPINPIMKKGTSAVIVFGNTGTVVPENPVSFYITDNEGVKTNTGDPIGPLEDEIRLVVEPLVPMILSESEFPALAYLEETGEDESTDTDTVTSTSDEDEDEKDPRLGVTPYIEDGVLTFSANEFIDIDSVMIKRNQPYALLDMKSNDVGTTTLSYQVSGFEGSTQLISHTTDPTEIHLSFPKNILGNSETLATIQVLDSVGNPVYTKKDLEIKLVSNDEKIVEIPQEITIKEGTYFTTFELNALDEGIIELALLSEDFSLTKYEINVIDITPVLALNFLGSTNWNERVEVKLSVTIPEITAALNGFEVQWESEGGEVKSTEEVTNNEGVATMNIIANDKDTISVTATVSGNGLSSQTLTKEVKIQNMPILEEAIEGQTEQVSESPTSELPLDLNTIIIIIIPVAVIAALFMLKRMDKLDMITEKIPMMEGIGDKFEEVKEKISDIKNR